MGAFDFIFKVGMDVGEVSKKSKEVESSISKIASGAVGNLASQAISTAAQLSGVSGAASNLFGNLAQAGTENFGAMASAQLDKVGLKGVAEAGREFASQSEVFNKVGGRARGIGADAARMGIEFDTNQRAGIVGIINEQEMAANKAERDFQDTINNASGAGLDYSIDSYKLFRQSMGHDGAKPWR